MFRRRSPAYGLAGPRRPRGLRYRFEPSPAPYVGGARPRTSCLGVPIGLRNIGRVHKPLARCQSYRLPPSLNPVTKYPCILIGKLKEIAHCGAHCFGSQFRVKDDLSSRRCYAATRLIYASGGNVIYPTRYCAREGSCRFSFACFIDNFGQDCEA